MRNFISIVIFILFLLLKIGHINKQKTNTVYSAFSLFRYCRPI